MYSCEIPFKRGFRHYNILVIAIREGNRYPKVAKIKNTI